MTSAFQSDSCKCEQSICTFDLHVEIYISYSILFSPKQPHLSFLELLAYKDTHTHTYKSAHPC